MFIAAIGVATALKPITSGQTPKGDDHSVIQARFRRLTWRSTVTPKVVEELRQGVNPGAMAAESTPTGLGATAVRDAVAKAGIPLDAIGLCVASTLTPYQTTPSEGQRIAGQLGLKIPAYDLPAGPAAWWLHLDMFTKFKRDRLPEYIACVYSDCPTHGIDSIASDYIGIFGDVACAVILAPKRSAGLKISSLAIAKQKTTPAVTFGPFRLTVQPQYLLSPDDLLTAVQHELRNWEKQTGMTRDQVTRVVLPEIYAPELAVSLAKLGLRGEQFTASSLETGYALGASVPCSVGAAVSGLAPGQSTLAIQCGDSYTGYAFMTVE